jgi:uncharacterized membrane protein YkvA (DUF1232 family)
MSGDQRRPAGFWTSLIRQLRLAWRLFWDPRIPVWTRFVPFIGLFYILSPIDFIPDPILGLGQLDDLGVLILSLRMFIALIPEDIKLQHLEAMGYRVSQWRVVEDEPQVIDAEYTVKEE